MPDWFFQNLRFFKIVNSETVSDSDLYFTQCKMRVWGNFTAKPICTPNGCTKSLLATLYGSLLFLPHFLFTRSQNWKELFCCPIKFFNLWFSLSCEKIIFGKSHSWRNQILKNFFRSAVKNFAEEDFWKIKIAATVTDNEKENLSDPSANRIETLEDDETGNSKKPLKKNRPSQKILKQRTQAVIKFFSICKMGLYRNSNP